MRISLGRIGLALVLAGLLPGCLPGRALIEAGLARPPDPVLASGVYVATQDGDRTLPTVPEAQIPPEFRRQTVWFPTDQPPGTIIIDPAAKHLYLVTGRDMATRYGISVGKAGFEWSGEARITGRRKWPSWTPPPEMIARKPELAKWKDGQPGGLDNPLGARALYLTTAGVDYGYRIHGTPEWASIGHNASSGCIRMINQDVVDLFDRVPDGTRVIVLNRDGTYPTRLTLPPPAPPPPPPPRPKPPAPKPQPKPAALPAFTPPLAGVPPALVAPLPAP